MRVGAKETGETAVYRLYDAAGALLYVSIGRNPLHRWGSHAAQHAWWPAVISFDVRWYETRAEAAAEERRALKHDGPVHNQLGTPRWPGIVSQHVVGALNGYRNFGERHEAHKARQRTDLMRKVEGEP